MGRDFTEQASRMAYDLDNGDGQLVAKKLREDSLRLPDEEFARLVYMTKNLERPGYGDDLNIRQVAGGEVVSVDKLRQGSRGEQYNQRIPAGEIVFTPIYDDRHQHDRNSRGIDTRSAIIGGVIGAVAGAVIKHQIDDHRDNRRDNNHRDNDRDHHRDRDHGDRDHHRDGNHHRDNDRDHRDDRRQHHDNRRR